MRSARRVLLLLVFVGTAGATALLIRPALGGTDDKPRTPYRPSCCAVTDFLAKWGCTADPGLLGGEEVPPLRRTACGVLYGLAQRFCDIQSCQLEG